MKINRLEVKNLCRYCELNPVYSVLKGTWRLELNSCIKGTWRLKLNPMYKGTWRLELNPCIKGTWRLELNPMYKRYLESRTESYVYKVPGD